MNWALSLSLLWRRRVSFSLPNARWKVTFCVKAKNLNNSLSLHKLFDFRENTFIISMPTFRFFVANSTGSGTFKYSSMSKNLSFLFLEFYQQKATWKRNVLCRAARFENWYRHGRDYVDDWRGKDLYLKDSLKIRRMTIDFIRSPTHFTNRPESTFSAQRKCAQDYYVFAIRKEENVYAVHLIFIEKRMNFTNNLMVNKLVYNLYIDRNN